MTRIRTSFRRFRASYARACSGSGSPVDPTRPGAAAIRDGVPIAHDGPPGYPGLAIVPNPYGDGTPAGSSAAGSTTNR